MLPSWRSAFPGIEPVTLTATAIHAVPIIRDLAAWLGLRQVSRHTFAHTLRTKRHVLVCPGGQRELLFADAMWHAVSPAVRLSTKHKGFCRVAVEQGAALLPVLSLGEGLHHRNVGHWRWLQQITSRCIGALVIINAVAVLQRTLLLSTVLTGIFRALRARL